MLGGVCAIVGLATLLGVRSALSPATAGHGEDSAGATSLAEADSVDHASVAEEDVSVVPSWDGGVGDAFGAANMQVRTVFGV